jgi:hypothetical protein
VLPCAAAYAHLKSLELPRQHRAVPRQYCLPCLSPVCSLAVGCGDGAPWPPLAAPSRGNIANATPSASAMLASVIFAERPGTQARKLVQSKHHDVEMSLRGFGLKVAKTSQRTFESHVRELVACYFDHRRLWWRILA